jgi:putative DNA primase/helicase
LFDLPSDISNLTSHFFLLMTRRPIPTDPFLRPSFDRAAEIVGAVRLTSLAKRPVEWLWPRRIPIGKVTLLVGDPGLGKSLVALDIAARVSTAKPWPDQERGSRSEDLERPATQTLAPNSSLLAPASALLLNAEDDLADTVLPRLEALGADCDRIVAIPSFLGSSCDGSVPRDHELRRDLARLRSLLDTLPDCRLIVIDPISAYLGGGGNASGEVRSLLVPLAELAHTRRLAIVAVSHLRKEQGSAIHRTMGSLAFLTAARAAWVICEDPANSERRLLLPVKSNLASRADGLAYTIEPKTAESLTPDSPAPSPQPQAPPTQRGSSDPINLSTDDGLVGRIRPLGRPKCERGEAAQWLKQALAAGPRPSREVEREAVANGFRPITLHRAFRDLDGKATRVGFGPLGRWFWQLPGIGDQNPPPNSDDLWIESLISNTF